jgi:very-short-patch-repair endonuclease
MTIPKPLIELALIQRGVFVRRQARKMGVSDHELRRLVAQNALLSPYLGVYLLLGARLDNCAHALAAALSTSPPAVVSHQSALSIWGAPTPFPQRPDILTMEGRPQRDAWFDAHRTRVWRLGDITEFDGIPITTPARSVIDSSAALSTEEVARCVDELIRLRVMTVDDLAITLGRFKVSRGRALARVGEVLGMRHPDLAPSDSALETSVASVLLGADLGRLVQQHPVRVGGKSYRLDLAYPDEKIGIEVDGREFHSGRRVFDSDRERQNALTLAGYLILRFTATTTPDTIVAATKSALRMRRSEP